MFLANRLLALVLLAGSPTDGDPLMLDFSASWCGPCQSTRPHVEKLKKLGYPIREIDVDNDPDRLAERFQVESVPTFVVVESDGSELDRLTGAQTASELASFYRRAARKPAANDDSETAPITLAPRSASTTANPWETVVRIKVRITKPRLAIGFGSGTVIYSDERQAIILTCAHIFKIEHARQQPSPSQFPYPVLVDLFDGQLKGGETPRVTTAEADIPAEIIDINHVGDVALIRIKPGRTLPASKVVPPGWKPTAGLKMTTLGCSQGHDATAWSTTVTQPRTVMQKDGGLYEATECMFAPIQGRSGGGLFTMDGVLAGVCDFNDAPRGGGGSVHRSPDYHGLYASPSTIHKLLDKHRLQICYQGNERAPRERDTLLAERGPSRAANSDAPKFRTQSPSEGEYPMPSPDVLGVRLNPDDTPVVAQASAERPSDASKSYRWRSALDDPDSGDQVASSVRERPVPGDRSALTRQASYGGPSTDVDLFPDSGNSSQTPALQAAGANKPVRERSSASRWRSVGSNDE